MHLILCNYKKFFLHSVQSQVFLIYFDQHILSRVISFEQTYLDNWLFYFIQFSTCNLHAVYILQINNFICLVVMYFIRLIRLILLCNNLLECLPQHRNMSSKKVVVLRQMANSGNRFKYYWVQYKISISIYILDFLMYLS